MGAGFPFQLNDFVLCASVVNRVFYHESRQHISWERRLRRD